MNIPNGIKINFKNMKGPRTQAVKTKDIRHTYYLIVWRTEGIKARGLS